VIRPVRIAELASNELGAAVRWYEEKRPGLGGELFDAVTNALSRIAQNPEIGARISADPRTRRLLVQKFPYHIVYRLTEAEIVVVAVAHLKRRPGKHRR
jgi:plasmid stabilization system protein ParE